MFSNDSTDGSYLLLVHELILNLNLHVFIAWKNMLVMYDFHVQKVIFFRLSNHVCIVRIGVFYIKLRLY